MRWRLLRLEPGRPPLAGPANMGLDEALVRTAVETGVPCLRFYQWDGPWLSVGYAQPFEDAQRHRLSEAGVGFVRRVTGGKAVLHGGDLTYSVAAPDGVLPAGVRESYEAIADALLAALGELGVPAQRSAEGSRAPGPGVFDCFAEPAADEICCGDRKLSGSAQRRTLGGFLQHGSIRLVADPPAAVAAVSAGGLGGTSLAEEGASTSAEAVQEACIRAFAGRFGADMEPASASPGELSAAQGRPADPRGQSQSRDEAAPALG